MKIRYFASIIAIILAWFFVSWLNIFSPILLPGPILVFLKLGVIIFSGNILPDLGMTLFRALAGLAISIIIGVPLGLIFGFFNKAYSYFEFMIDFMRSIPATALIPLFLLFFGIGNASKIIIVVFVSSLIIIVNTIYGVKSANKTRIMVGKSFHLSRFGLFSKIILPEAAQSISAGIRVAISMSLVIVIVAEMFIGTRAGLGHRIIDAQYVYNTTEMYAVIILVGIIGYFLNRMYSVIEARKIHWAGK